MEISGKKAIRALIQDTSLHRLIKNIYLLHTQKDLINLCSEYRVKYEIKEKAFFDTNYSDRSKYKYKYAIAIIDNKPRLSFEKFLAKNKDKEESLIVVVDRLQDPFNLGAILRSCAAFGVTGVIIPKNNQAPINHYAVLKASQGYSLRVDTVIVSNLPQTILVLKKLGYWIYATDLNEKSKNCREIKYSNKKILIIGNEGDGVSHILKKISDYLIYIPMQKGIDSLNVSVATGILLFEITK